MSTTEAFENYQGSLTDHEFQMSEEFNEKEKHLIAFWDNKFKGKTELSIKCNSIGPYGAKLLVESLKKNQTLTTLRLHITSIGNLGADHFGEFLKSNHTITELDIQSSEIGTPGAMHLSLALRKNETLTDLNLRGNDIGDRGVCYFYENLKKNETLKILNLNGCNISSGYLLDKLYESIDERQKYKTERRKLLLLSRTFNENSCLYKEKLPLDVFKLIWGFSRL